MAKRIGETLVEKGLISRKQLSQALRYQLMFGGHLGTSLIELGFIDEESLGRALAECLNLRYAAPALLQNVPPRVIRTLRPDQVEKYQVIPIDLRNRDLHVAVISSRNLHSLSVATGYRVVPWISPEFRILEAMERYYQVPRRPRYLTISHELGRGTGPATSGPAPWASAERGPSLSPTEEAALHPSMLGVGAGELATARPEARPTAAPTSSPASSIGDGAVDLGGAYGLGGSWREIAERIDRRIAEVSAPPGKPAPARPQVPATPAIAEEAQWTFEELSLLMSHADSRDELSSVVLSFVSRSTTACALFGVKGDDAYIWDCRQFELPRQTLSEFVIPVAADSVFELLLGSDYYRGRVPSTPGCRRFYERLGRPIPREVALLPVYLNDRLIAVLYGEGDERGIRESTETYLQLVQKLSLALHMIVLKLKIRARG